VITQPKEAEVAVLAAEALEADPTLDLEALAKEAIALTETNRKQHDDL